MRVAFAVGLGVVTDVGRSPVGGRDLQGHGAGEDIPPVIPYEWLGYSVVVGVGVLAGFLPARRATKIQPVKALSYE